MKSNGFPAIQVVVLRPGDLTQEQADKVLKEDVEGDDGEGNASTTGAQMKFSTKTKRSGTQDDVDDRKKKKLLDDLKKKSNVKAVKNTCLLSFDEDDEDS